MRIKNRKKFIRGILIIIELVSLLICKSTLSYDELEYKTVHVSRGETLWEIAENEQKNNSYYANKDIREIVNNIKNINKLEDLNLYEGQEILIAI